MSARAQKGKGGSEIPSGELQLREARLGDIDALLALEDACFDTDQLGRRNFRWMIRKANAALLVAHDGERLAGYILVLFHAGTSLGRIYSVAVNPECRGRGVADRLVAAAEEAALAADCAWMRLEVRPDNASAIRLYEKHGYRQFGVYPRFYEDDTDALRFEKRILRLPSFLPREVAHYPQTTGFTCGPAALMMAAHALRPSFPMDVHTEFAIWREATTIYMTSGHGGCGPHGLALAAARRGFHAEMYLNRKGPLFVDGVRSPGKKRVLELVHADFTRQLAGSGVVVHDRAPTIADYRRHLDAGGIPLVLVSHYPLSRTKTPHWLVMVAADDQFVYLHDPEIDVAQHKSVTDSMYVPVRHANFLRMSRYGQAGLRTSVVVGAP